MAERKKGFRLRFWKKKEKDLPEVELTRKPCVIDLHEMMLAQEQGPGAVELEDVPAEEDDFSTSDRPTRLGFVNTTNPIIKEAATNLFIFLFDEIKKLEFMTGAGLFRSIMDFVGREALLEIQTILTSKMEEIVTGGASPDDGEIFGQDDISIVLNKLTTYLSERFDATTAAAYALAFDDCLRKVNTIVIDLTNETVEDENSVVIGQFYRMALNEDNSGMEEDPDRIIGQEDEEDDRPNGAAGEI